jgi:small subunit ribosomal protein S7
MAKRLTLFDPAAVPDCNPELAARFIRCLMGRGKTATAQRIFSQALDQIKKRMPDADPLDVFTQAVEHVKPSVELRSKRVGSAIYQVPMQVNKNRQQGLAIRWIIKAARRKAGRPMYLRLAEEILAAYQPGGPTGPPGTSLAATAQCCPRRVCDALPG